MLVATSRAPHLRRPDVTPRLNEKSPQAMGLLAWWPMVPEIGRGSRFANKVGGHGTTSLDWLATAPPLFDDLGDGFGKVPISYFGGEGISSYYGQAWSGGVDVVTGNWGLSCWAYMPAEPYHANASGYVEFVKIGLGTNGIAIGTEAGHTYVGLRETVSYDYTSIVLTQGWHLLGFNAGGSYISYFLDGKEVLFVSGGHLTINDYINIGGVLQDSVYERIPQGAAIADVRIYGYPGIQYHHWLDMYQPRTRFELYQRSTQPRMWFRPAAGAALDTTRPSGTVDAGSWTPVGAATLHAATNDESDSTLAQSSTGATSDTMKLSFPAMGVPDDGTVTFYIRHRKTP